MKLFVDTGDVKEVRQAAEWGILDGVTTNPTLIAKSGRGFKETVLEICELVPGGDISAEVVATDYPTMLKEALEPGVDGREGWRDLHFELCGPCG